jgi:carbamate kinase
MMLDCACTDSKRGPENVKSQALGWGKEAAMSDELHKQIEKALKRKRQQDARKRFLAIMEKYKVDMDDPAQKNALKAANEFWVEVLKENDLIQTGTWT